jgi:hypothetical protein
MHAHIQTLAWVSNVCVHIHSFNHPSTHNDFICEDVVLVCFQYIYKIDMCTKLITFLKPLSFMMYFRQIAGFYALNEAIKKLESELQSLVETGESF